MPPHCLLCGVGERAEFKRRRYPNRLMSSNHPSFPTGSSTASRSFWRPGPWGGELANHTVFLTESDVVMGTTMNMPIVLARRSGVSVHSVEIRSSGVAGVWQTVYLMWDGTVWAVGKIIMVNWGTELPRIGAIQYRWWMFPEIPQWVVAISAVYDHMLYLKGNGTAWRRKKHRRSTGGRTTTQRNNPVQ